MSPSPDPYAAVVDLQARYAIALDRGQLELLRACFADDATLSVGGAVVERGADAIAARLIGRGSRDVMHLSYVTALGAREGDVVVATSYFALVDTTDGRTTAVGEYEDTIVLAPEGGSRFASREVLYRWRA